MNASERRAVAGLSVLATFRMLGLFMVLPLLAVYSAELEGSTPALVGLAIGAHGLTQALLQVPLGWLSDRVGRKPVILGGLVVFALGSLLAGLATSIEGIVLGRFLQGCGAISSALLALAADYTRDEQRTKAMAIIGACIGLAFVVALVVGPLVAAVAGLSGAFFLTSLLAMAGILLVVVVLPRVPDQPPGTPRDGVNASLVRDALAGRGLPPLYLSIFLLHFMLMAAFVVIPVQLAEGAGLPSNHHWAVYLVAVVLSVPGVLLLLRQRSRGDVALRPSFLVAALLTGVGLLGCLATQSLWPLGTALVVFFTGFNTLEAALPSAVSKLAPQALRGTAMGVFTTAQFFGVFLGGSFGGALYGWGGQGVLAGFMGVLLLIWLLVLSRWREVSSEATVSVD